MGGILRKGTCFWEMDRDQELKSRWWFWMCFFHPRGSPWLCLLCNPEVACSISPYIPSSWMLKATICLNLFTKQEQIHRLWEWTYDCWGFGEDRKGRDRELGMDMYILLYLKWITEDLLYKHRELCSMLYASLNGREVWGRMDIRIYMAESFHCLHENITILLIGYTLT